MIYCYLSDTALTPLLSNESHLDQAMTDYNSIMGVNGVCQVNERVISMFNTEYTAEIPVSGGSSVTQKYPNLILDPRTPSRNKKTHEEYQSGRIRGLFEPKKDVAVGCDVEYAAGEMMLHYDAYRAATGGEVGNYLAILENSHTNNAQFAQLFNIIETCMLSHTYDQTDNVWVYKTSAALDAILSNNVTKYGAGSTTEHVAGYVYGSIVVPSYDITSDKKARVRNKNSELNDNVIKDNIGTDSTLTSYTADIIFPDYIQFSYRFSDLDAATHFRIYLNPRAFIDQYNLNTITHVVCPTFPEDMFDLSYDNVEYCLTKSSKYVANILTGEVTKTTEDPLLSTNCTGAYALTTTYIPNGSSTIESEYKFTFTCIYKGRKPNTSELRTAVRELLEEAHGGSTAEERSVKQWFPDLYATTSYILVPMYETRIITDTNTNIAYCSNIFSGKQEYLNYNGYNSASTLSEVPSEIKNINSVMNAPAYYMHILTYPEDYTNTESSRLDEIVEFKSYQPIGTTDVYWPTLTDYARKLNTYISKLIAYQLSGYKPTDIDFTVENKTIFGEDKPRTYLTFSVGDYSFSIMTRESYLSAN